MVKQVLGLLARPGAVRRPLRRLLLQRRTGLGRRGGASGRPPQLPPGKTHLQKRCLFFKKPFLFQSCINALRSQVRMEFQASLQYLLMGSYVLCSKVSKADSFLPLFRRLLRPGQRLPRRLLGLLFRARGRGEAARNQVRAFSKRKLIIQTGYVVDFKRTMDRNSRGQNFLKICFSATAL